LPAPPAVIVQVCRRFGFTGLTIGLSINALILYAEISAYK